MSIPRHLGAILAGAVALLSAAPAFAHPGRGASSLTDGLFHPWSGVDHLLAMTAVGLLAARRGGTALVLWPLVFVGAMLVGYGWGRGGGVAWSPEPAVLASVILLGALVAAAAQAPSVLGVVVVSLSGLAHGLAHGADGPAGAGAAFAIGFVASTLVLHGLGLAVGLAVNGVGRDGCSRLLGGSIALGGVVLALASQA